MKELVLRDARPGDARTLVDIYSYYVTDTAVTFEYAVPSESEFRSRIENISSTFPYIVCEMDGVVAGYAYASAYSTREAYSWTVTASIYLDKEYRRNGAGSALYAELEKRLKEKGIVNILASIAYIETEDEYLTHDSVKFHTYKGYSQVAHMNKVGKKFDRWYDIIWMQKVIG